MKKLIKKHIEFITNSIILTFLGRLVFLENSDILLLTELICATIVLVANNISEVTGE
tara:strand:- start:78 stop:248 length:171 start_codon:yes stop_codon:yes gene_type:complete